MVSCATLSQSSAYQVYVGSNACIVTGNILPPAMCQLMTELSRMLFTYMYIGYCKARVGNKPDLLIPTRADNDMHSVSAVLATTGNLTVCHLHDQLLHIVTPVLHYQHTSLILQDVKHAMILLEARQHYYMK